MNLGMNLGMNLCMNLYMKNCAPKSSPPAPQRRVCRRQGRCAARPATKACRSRSGDNPASGPCCGQRLLNWKFAAVLEQLRCSMLAASFCEAPATLTHCLEWLTTRRLPDQLNTWFGVPRQLHW